MSYAQPRGVSCWATTIPEEEAKIVLEGILSAFLQWHQLTERMTSSKCENFQKRLCVELSYKCAIAYREGPLKKEARQKKFFWLLQSTRTFLGTFSPKTLLDIQLRIRALWLYRGCQLVLFIVCWTTLIHDFKHIGSPGGLIKVLSIRLHTLYHSCRSGSQFLLTS